MGTWTQDKMRVFSSSYLVKHTPILLERLSSSSASRHLFVCWQKRECAEFVGVPSSALLHCGGMKTIWTINQVENPQIIQSITRFNLKALTDTSLISVSKEDEDQA